METINEILNTPITLKYLSGAILVGVVVYYLNLGWLVIKEIRRKLKEQ